MLASLAAFDILSLGLALRSVSYSFDAWWWRSVEELRVGLDE